MAVRHFQLGFDVSAIFNCDDEQYYVEGKHSGNWYDEEWNVTEAITCKPKTQKKKKIRHERISVKTYNIRIIIVLIFCKIKCYPDYCQKLLNFHLNPIAICNKFF